MANEDYSVCVIVGDSVRTVEVGGARSVHLARHSLMSVVEKLRRRPENRGREVRGQIIRWAYEPDGDCVSKVPTVIFSV